MTHIVEFYQNKDNTTCSMIFNGILVDFEIAYVPEKCVDNRGLTLFQYMKKKNLSAKDGLDIELSKEGVMIDIQNIQNGFSYMFNPVYVKKAIEYNTNRKLK